MAWFGDGLSSLSNLKGQITSFTKEVLSEGIVEETDQRTRELNEANERCVQMQELLNSKDAEISLLRRQNCELQKAVVELNASRPRESNESNSLDDEGGGGFFWDPPPAKNRDGRSRNAAVTSLLQERLSQATLRIGELENELKYLRANSNQRSDEKNEGHPRAEFSRAKQDMVNRIIQIGEKGDRDAEKNHKRSSPDETTLVNDFQAALSRLETREQYRLINSALRALDTHHEDSCDNAVSEKGEKFVRPRLQSISLLSHIEETDLRNGTAENGDEVANGEGREEIESLRAKVRELQQENEFLTTSLEELDKEHGQSMETVLLMKDQLTRKHESLQKAYEQLYVECNQAQTKLQLLEKGAINFSDPETNNNDKNNISENSTSEQLIASADKEVQATNIRERETNAVHVQTMKTVVETKQVQTNPSDSRSVEVETTRLQNENKECQTESVNEKDVSHLEDLRIRVNEILKNCRLEEAREDESLFENVARQYVETSWKKEMLERKLNDVTRELKESSEMRESLQIDCYDLQTNIESLLLQIEHLKSNLPSIPEASEERVASLETETESMCEEIKRLNAEHEALKVNNYELVTSISVLEGSLRNQENLEAEVRNTKQQLEIAKQQLDGASKNVENNENMMEDLSRRMHIALEENNELRRKIDALEIAERRANEERIKRANEYEEKIEQVTREIERAREELAASSKCIESLEDELANANEARNELERDIEDISLEKERLETERHILRENSTEKETSDLLQNLRERLDLANHEKNDLEYDLKNMRKELDIAIDKGNKTESRMAELNFENDKLVKENNELIEQLSVNEKESSERIELLQTEMNLLNHEHSTLKNDLSSEQAKLSKLREKNSSFEKKNADLEAELASRRSELSALSSANEELMSRAESLEQRVDELKVFEEMFLKAEEKCRRLDAELSSLQELRRELDVLRDTCKNLESERYEAAKHSETRVVELQKRCDELEALVSATNEEKDELRRSRAERDQRISELEHSLRELEFSGVQANENASMAKETIESLSRLIKERDEEIEALKLAAATTLEDRERERVALASLRTERDDIVRLVQEKHNANVQYYAEIERLAKLANEQTSNLQHAVAERDEITAKVVLKDGQISSLQSELGAMRERLEILEKSKNGSETCNVAEHSKQMARASLLNEKCNALEAALIQEQSNNRIIQNQLTESESREATAARELERLRTHLVEMEASYTEEALIAEENRKQLEAKLLQVEEKAQTNSTVYTSASIRANQQVETLQQQIALIVQQRDEIQAKLSAAEDKVLAHSASLTNLQIVLEQFQRDKENDIRMATERLRQQLNVSYKEQEDLRNEIVNLRTQLSEAKECLQAASRLSEQLDKKSERIEELNEEVSKLTELVNTADQRIQEATRNGEGKVDKNLVKNLLLGFLTASTLDKSSVLRVFATVLEFDDAEREKIGLNHPAASGGWFSGLLGSGGSHPTKDDEASLSAAFVRFLESESRPKPQLPALTITNSSLSRPGHSRQHSSSSSTHSGLLLSNITLPSFPDFVPSRNTGSILKEVLKDS